MTNKEAIEFGQKARKEVFRLDPRLADWDIFKRTFGFYQWKKQHLFTDQLEDAFAKGFNYPDEKL